MTLEAALDQAIAGAGGFVSATGETGVGKSRLVRDLCDMAAGRGLPVLVGRAVDTGTPVPFRPLFEALSGHVRRLGADGGPWVDRRALAQLVPEWRSLGEEAYPASAMEIGDLRTTPVLCVVTTRLEGSDHVGRLLVTDALQDKPFDMTGVEVARGEHVAAFDRAASDAVAELGRDGALDKAVTLPFGTFSGEKLMVLAPGQRQNHPGLRDHADLFSGAVQESKDSGESLRDRHRTVSSHVAGRRGAR